MDVQSKRIFIKRDICGGKEKIERQRGETEICTERWREKEGRNRGERKKYRERKRRETEGRERNIERERGEKQSGEKEIQKEKEIKLYLWNLGRGRDTKRRERHIERHRDKVISVEVRERQRYKGERKTYRETQSQRGVNTNPKQSWVAQQV